MEFIYVFILLICIVIIYKHFENKSYDVTYVQSSINGKEYLVRNLEDKQQVADLLGNMCDRFNKLINYLKKTDSFKLYKLYVVKNNELEQDKLNKTQLKEFNKFETDIKRLIKNYNSDAISENTPDSAYTSYSENKGQRLVFCVRAKRTNKIVDLNTMMFVALHEFSHLMTKSIGHTPEFWSNFKILLRIAIRNSIYICQNYEQKSEAYCGTEITDTPLKCGDI